ncbi:MAG: hypothetical protein R3E01_09305 [Pirellulaceae bacterium]
MITFVRGRKAEGSTTGVGGISVSGTSCITGSETGTSMGAAWGAALLQLQGPPLAQPQLHPAPQPQAGLAVLQPVLQPLVQPQPPLHPLPQPSVHPLPQPQPSVHPQPLPHLLQGNMRFSTSFKLGRQRGTAQPVEVQPEAQGSAQPPLHPHPPAQGSSHPQPGSEVQPLVQPQPQARRAKKFAEQPAAAFLATASCWCIRRNNRRCNRPHRGRLRAQPHAGSVAQPRPHPRRPRSLAKSPPPQPHALAALHPQLGSHPPPQGSLQPTPQPLEQPAELQPHDGSAQPP